MMMAETFSAFAAAIAASLMNVDEILVASSLTLERRALSIASSAATSAAAARATASLRSASAAAACCSANCAAAAFSAFKAFACAASSKALAASASAISARAAAASRSWAKAPSAAFAAFRAFSSAATAEICQGPMRARLMASCCARSTSLMRSSPETFRGLCWSDSSGLAALATGAADRQRAGSAVPSLHTGWPLWIASVVNVTSATLDGMRGDGRHLKMSVWPRRRGGRRQPHFPVPTKRISRRGFVIHSLCTARPAGSHVH